MGLNGSVASNSGQIDDAWNESCSVLCSLKFVSILFTKSFLQF